MTGGSPELDVDVLVAGAGGAGLSAALAATDTSCTVLLAEAKENFRFGCNTAMSTSMIPAGGSRWQQQVGIEDSPHVFLDDILRKTRGTADPIIARALTQVAPELVGWLSDACGVPLELPTDFLYPGHTRHRCHCVHDRNGGTLLGYLLEMVQSRDRVTLAVPMRLRSVQLDDSGSVASATLEAPDGSLEVVRTGAVILAVGGFGGNRALVHRYIPEIENALYFGSDGNQGDALSIGASLRADVGYLDAYQGHGSVAVPQGILCTWISLTHGGILINQRGERFGDEMKGYSEFARYVVAQPDGIGYVVFDRRIDALCRPFADYQSIVDNHAVVWAESASELAQRIGVPPVALAATLDDALSAARGTAPDPLGREVWEAPLTAPYASVKVTGALFHTQGGLLVNADAAVLKNGEPIPGLYAAGGAAAGLSGKGADGYMGGNGLLAALGLGYLAGHSAARARQSPWNT